MLLSNLDPLAIQGSHDTLSVLIRFVFVSCSLYRATGEVNNDIVVEMKTEKANEEAGLLNKRPSTEQVSQ